MSEESTIALQKHRSKVAAYVIGLLLSLVLTLGAYLCVVNGLLSGNALLAAIFGLALVQLLVQLVFFLHLGSEKKPRINLIAFLFMALVVVIIVLGSVWIMKNLHYNMTPEQASKYLYEDEGYGRD